MIARDNLYDIAHAWLIDNGGLARWVMSKETLEHIALNLFCDCARPGSPREVHTEGCPSRGSSFGFGFGPARLFGWEIQVDDSVEGVRLEAGTKTYAVNCPLQALSTEDRCKHE